MDHRILIIELIMFLLFMVGANLAEGRIPEQLSGVGSSRKLLQAQCQPAEQVACIAYCVARQFKTGICTTDGVTITSSCVS